MIEKDYTIDEQYKDLLQTILTYGKEKKDRTGTGTKSTFGYTIRWDMTQGFPLLTTKRMPMKTIATELKWFLKGDTNIKYLHDNNCHIWDGDYKKSGRTDGELGPIYGKQWRDWNGEDQIKNLINELKIDPDSRRLMVSAWNVNELDKMTLPPCHYGFQMYTTELTLEERQLEFCYRLGKDVSYAKKLEHIDLDKDYVPKRKISLMWNQRSVDVFLGLPFNIASYALLLKLIGKEVNMVPDQLVGNLGDTHLYLNHLDQAKEQLKREPYCLPELKVSKVDILNGEFNYELHSYESHLTIKAPLSN
uniref:thymidylate synthase n=1 Tax=Virus NIOZ-UU157 TaxID=2763269 RepID=A0A7S9XH42_9VIRU|nr:MAG: thymidylate synthase [Virus NIOZ-UU157]